MVCRGRLARPRGRMCPTSPGRPRWRCCVDPASGVESGVEAGNGRRTRWTTTAHRPSRPRDCPPTRVGATSVPGSRTARVAARETGATRSPRPRSRPSTMSSSNRPSAEQRVGSSAAAARAYPAGEGWNRSELNISVGRCENSGPSRSPSDTVWPPASTTVTVWAAARSRLHRRARARRGWAMGWTAPRSGQVPTTTTAPASRSRVTAASRWRTAIDLSIRCVTSLAPMSRTAASGRPTPSRTLATCRPRSAETAPTTAPLVRRTRRPAKAETPTARMAPMVCPPSSVPRPAALLSPRTTSSSGRPGPAP